MQFSSPPSTEAGDSLHVTDSPTFPSHPYAFCIPLYFFSRLTVFNLSILPPFSSSILNSQLTQSDPKIYQPKLHSHWFSLHFCLAPTNLYIYLICAPLIKDRGALRFWSIVDALSAHKIWLHTWPNGSPETTIAESLPVSETKLSNNLFTPRTITLVIISVVKCTGTWFTCMLQHNTRQCMWACKCINPFFFIRVRS